MKKILYKILSWGLGHTTRTLPILRHLVKRGHEVHVATQGRPLELVTLELGDSVRTIETPDILTTWGRECHWAFLLPKFWILPHTLKRLKAERQWVEERVRNERYDMVVSESCFGASSREVPSYLVAHHLKVFWFVRAQPLMRLNERLMANYANQFDRILVPDMPGDGESVAGELARGFRHIDAGKVRYIGILSDYSRAEGTPDIDYLISISGSEPQRTVFEKAILAQIPRLKGKVVVTCGKPEEAKSEVRQVHGARVYGFLPKKDRDELMNRSRLVISRSGYCTLMDLAELEKQALLVPQRNQTEQEYLATYHRKKGTYYSVDLLKKIDLSRDVDVASTYPGLRGDSYRTTTSVDRFMHGVGLA